MRFDIFLSICQTEVDGYLPDEATMFRNFFEQVELADKLGFEIAWIAESHLSSEVQKMNKHPVIEHFKGEVGLNTDIFQLAHKIFARCKRIEVGSAIRNILCNGGPLAHAEALKTFLTLHGLDPLERRKLYLGYAAGRFPFTVEAYGIKARNKLEEKAWPVLRGLIFKQAVEIFNRALSKEAFSIKDVSSLVLEKKQFRSEEHWQEVLNLASESHSKEVKIHIDNFWDFEKLGVIPFEAPMHLAQLVLGSHDPSAQILANQYRNHWIFNLSITPSEIIEKTHERMQEHYHSGSWQRSYLPRTALIFINADPAKSSREQSVSARAAAEKALRNYWQAMDGTIDPNKLNEAIDNALVGNPSEIINQIKERFHPDDRIMLWFDFNNHNSRDVQASMEYFCNQVQTFI